MPLDLSSEEQQRIYAALHAAPDHSPARLRQIATDLLESMVLDLVEGIARDIASAQRASEAERRYHFYPLVEPLTDENRYTDVTASDGTIHRTPRAPQIVYVRLVDLAAFCTEHGLTLRQMERVGEGEVKEHRGWTRGPWTGKNYEMGSVWREPRKINPSPAPAKAGPRIQMADSPSPISGPHIHYTPAEWPRPVPNALRLG